MAEPRADASTKVIRRVFLAQIALLGAIGALVVAGLYVSEQLGSFPLSFCAGCLGGSIALLKRLPGESDVVLGELSTSWVTSIMPMLYGGLMAVVAYLLFMSGILTGDGGTGLFTSNLFPNFTRPTAKEGHLLSIVVLLDLRPSTVQDFGKLLVWCFIAGYSEKFVSGILKTLEDRSGREPD